MKQSVAIREVLACVGGRRRLLALLAGLASILTALPYALGRCSSIEEGMGSWAAVSALLGTALVALALEDRITATRLVRWLTLASLAVIVVMQTLPIARCTVGVGVAATGPAGLHVLHGNWQCSISHVLVAVLAIGALASSARERAGFALGMVILLAALLAAAIHGQAGPGAGVS